MKAHVETVTSDHMGMASGEEDADTGVADGRDGPLASGACRRRHDMVTWRLYTERFWAFPSSTPLR